MKERFRKSCNEIGVDEDEFYDLFTKPEMGRKKLEDYINGISNERGKDMKDKQVIFEADLGDVLLAEQVESLFKNAKCKCKAIGDYISNGQRVPRIKNVKFNEPATIVFWKDGSKTVVKAYEKFDPEKGIAMAIAKKAMGNKGSYYDEITKWVSMYEEDLDNNWNIFANEEALDQLMYGYDKDDHLSSDELHDIIDSHSVETAVKIIEERIKSKNDDIDYF